MKFEYIIIAHELIKWYILNTQRIYEIHIFNAQVIHKEQKNEKCTNLQSEGRSW